MYFTVRAYGCLQLYLIRFCTAYTIQSELPELELWSDDEVEGSDVLLCTEAVDLSSNHSSIELEIETAFTPKEEESYKPILHLYLFFLLMFQTLFHISDTALNLLLKFMAMFFMTLQQKFNAFPQVFLEMFPRNVETVRRQVANSRD